MISWEFRLKNSFWNFRVGICVGEQAATNARMVANAGNDGSTWNNRPKIWFYVGLNCVGSLSKSYCIK